jgi:hypothetical protein
MVIVEPDWISDDALNLRAFLYTPTGRKLLEILSVRRPAFFADDFNPDASFARARSIAGYELAVHELIDLSLPAPPAEPEELENLPDLNNDAKWKHLEQL